MVEVVSAIAMHKVRQMAPLAILRKLSMNEGGLVSIQTPRLLYSAMPEASLAGWGLTLGACQAQVANLRLRTSKQVGG